MIIICKIKTADSEHRHNTGGCEDTMVIPGNQDICCKCGYGEAITMVTRFSILAFYSIEIINNG